MTTFNAHAFVDGAEGIGYGLAGAIVAGHQVRRADAARASVIRARTARFVAAHQAARAEAIQRRDDAARVAFARQVALRRALAG